MIYVFNTSQANAISDEATISFRFIKAIQEINPARVNLEEGIVYGNDSQGQVDTNVVAIQNWAIPMVYTNESDDNDPLNGRYYFEAPVSTHPLVQSIKNLRAAVNLPALSNDHFTKNLNGSLLNVEII